MTTDVELIADLHRRLRQAEETRDAAQAEATRQTERARALGALVETLQRGHEDLHSRLKDVIQERDELNGRIANALL